MKNIAILGASRAGKSTLARMINEIYPKYHIITGDSIRRSFQEELPQNEINNFDGNGMKEDFARFSSSLFKNQIRKNERYYNYIFDSCDISVENALKYFNNDNIIFLFLGYTELTEEEAFNNYRKYEEPGDWTCRKTNEQLREHAKTWINKSKIFKEDCMKNRVRYIDTSYNRDEILEKLKEELLKEII